MICYDWIIILYMEVWHTQGFSFEAGKKWPTMDMLWLDYNIIYGSLAYSGLLIWGRQI